MDFSAWAEKYLGHGRLERLRERAHSTRKFTKADLEDIYQHLRKEQDSMRKLRAEGVTGRIEFEDPT